MPSDRVVLVTGAFGGLATRVLAQLVEDRAVLVVAIGRSAEKKHFPPKSIQLINGDLRDGAVWAEAPRSITHVLHLAAAIPWQQAQQTLANVVSDNVIPLGHLLEHAQRWPALRQIVYASSVSVYDWSQEVLQEDSPKHPADLYGAAKLAGEDILEAGRVRGIRVACLRYSSLFGSGQYPGTALPTMIRAARETGLIRVYGEGRRSQDFLHYDDAARATLLASGAEADGPFNIGSGTAVTMKQLAEWIGEIFTAGKAEIVYERHLPEGDPGFRMDISKTVKELGYAPCRDLKLALARLKREMGGA